jgi:hypothetical protein
MLYWLFLLTVVPLGHSCGAAQRANHSEGISPGGDSAKTGGETPVSRAAALKDYAAPDGAFSVKLPHGWEVKREEDGESYMTVFTSGEYRAANLSILTGDTGLIKTAPTDLQDYTLTDASQGPFQGWLDGLKEQARVESSGKVYRTRVDGIDALRLDVTYYRGDGDDPRKGYALFLIGQKKTFFISLTGARPGFAELEKIISTLDIEP